MLRHYPRDNPSSLPRYTGYPMRALSFALLLTAAPLAPAADEKTTLATGDWGEAVNGLRGRLVLAQGRTLGDGKIRESLVYVELENVENTHSGRVDVQFDPDALKCELTDAGGKTVVQAPVAGSGGRPGKSVVAIPFDSSARLRANPYAFGRAEGLLIHLNTGSWHVKDDAEYRLSGTLTVIRPEGKADAWKGELKMAVKFSLKTARPWSEKKGGVAARLRLERDDELRSVRVFLEVNNSGGFGGGVAFPGEPQVELSVLDADGKPLKATFAAVSLARAADPADAVIAGGSTAEFRVDRVSAKTGRAGYLLLANEVWELEAGKAYTVKARVVSKAKDPKGWAGPLDLPPVEFRP
jgi:hypothetical protein